VKLNSKVFIVATVLITAALAQAAEHGVMVREAALFLSPDKTSQKLANVGRGREVAVLDRSPGWAHVLATIDQNFGSDRDISGWVADKGLITAATPKGDQIMYGEAVDSENEASRRGGRKGAAQDAMRLYARMAEYFPTSPLAGEALYRSADIRWQIEKEDQQGRRSAKARDPHDRLPIEEHYMKEVRKKFPHTQWADLADFEMIDNKLCGDWQAQSKCPEKEADIYENYAKEHPESPKLAEALYNAAWRYACLMEIYQTEGKAGNIKGAAQKSLSAAQRVLTAKATPDWSARAQRLIYMVENNIPVFGNNVE
jgi:hypothetical protein